ncbi:MAG: FHA domain-containing protein [Phycisphaerales bacterium]
MLELQVCTLGGRILRAFAIGDRSDVIVGRDETCDVRIDSPRVAEEHCAIEPEGDQLVVRDLGSGCLTLVRGRPIEKVRVENGLEVVVGPALLRFVET